MNTFMNLFRPLLAGTIAVVAFIFAVLTLWNLVS